MGVRPISRQMVIYICLVSRIATALVLIIPSSIYARDLDDKIVFVSNRNATPEIFLVEGLDGNPIQLTRNMFASSPAISPDGTEVVFVSSPPGGQSDIFKLHIATNRIEKLTVAAEWDASYSDLDWSPDGQQILFITSIGAHEGDKTNLSVMNMNSRDIRHILQPDLPTRISNPSWSPDSQDILFSQEDEGLLHDRLFITDDNGNNVVEVRQEELKFLTDASSFRTNTIPAWSPSRHKIAYITLIESHRTPPKPLQIYSMNLADGRVVPLTSGDAVNSIPMAWSPDGRKILFTAIPFDQDAESNDIYVMDSDGTNMINLTQSAENEGFASLSPSGKEIVFDKFIGEENSAIYVMDANGRNPRQLTFEPGLNAASFWSPDGEKIAFLSNRDGGRRIYTMDREGNNIQQITHRQRKFDGAPAWSPDGKWIAFGSGDKGSWGLYLIEPQGNNERLIYRSNLSSLDSVALFRPAWSSDSKSLVFVDPWGEASVGLVKIQIDEGMPTQINNEELIYWLSAVWSPDGNSLLFSAAKKKDDPFYIDQIPTVFLANLNTSERREFNSWGILHLDFKSDWSFRRLVWAPDGSQLMLSIEQKGMDTQHDKRLYLIDTASETASFWMKDAAEADWVRPGFVYAVNPREKWISTWAELKKPEVP